MDLPQCSRVRELFPVSLSDWALSYTQCSQRGMLCSPVRPLWGLSLQCCVLASSDVYLRRLALCFHKPEGRSLVHPVFREVRSELLKKPQTHQDHVEAEASQTAALLRLHHPLSIASSPLPPIGMGLGEPAPE